MSVTTLRRAAFRVDAIRRVLFAIRFLGHEEIYQRMDVRLEGARAKVQRAKEQFRDLCARPRRAARRGKAGQRVAFRIPRRKANPRAGPGGLLRATQRLASLSTISFPSSMATRTS